MKSEEIVKGTVEDHDEKLEVETEHVTSTTTTEAPPTTTPSPEEISLEDEVRIPSFDEWKAQKQVEQAREKIKNQEG